jgi:hypothetical protein
MKKNYLKQYFVFWAIVTFPFASNAQSIIRGPYLQSPSPNSMVIRWRTDSLTDSRVYFGNTVGATTSFADSVTSTTEHRVKVTGLLPKTKYYYSIGSSTQTLRGNDPELYFTTSIDSLMTDSVRFWAIGDFGHGNDAERKVRDSYVNFCAAHPADFQLWLGDNAYSDGTDAEYQAHVFDTVNCFGNLFLHLPFVPTSGNHDWNSICNWQAPCNTDPNLQDGSYLHIIDPPTEGEQGGFPSHKKLFYSFDYGDIHFVCLNSELGSGITQSYNWIGMNNWDTTFTSPMYEWLKTDLASTHKKWKIAFWHQCPYSGQDDFTELSSFQLFCIAMRTHANPILEKYGVDLVLTGHDHNYQRSFLINGHYGYKADFAPSMMINGSSGKDDIGEAYVKYTNGPLAGKGTVYVLEGNSSEGNTISPISHPAIYWGEACDTCFGSTIIDVHGDRLDGNYITSNGVVRDHFTIKKETWTGIDEEQSAFDHLYAFPNPFSEQTRVGYTVLKKCDVKIDIMDINGRVILNRYNGMREPGDYYDIIDMDSDDMADGTYVVRFNCGGVIKYRRIIKQ